MQVTRRELFIMTTAPLAVSCGLQSSPASPSTSRLEPWDKVISPKNATVAVLRYRGYARGNQRLLQAMLDTGLNPQLRSAGYGEGTWEISDATFGWVFCVQNDVFDADLTSVTLGNDDLWAAYEKLSEG